MPPSRTTQAAPPEAPPPIALVTGSSRGLGRGVALALAGAGWSLGLHYASNLEAAREAEGLCRAAAGSAAQRFELFRCDLSSPAARAGLLAEVHAAFGEIDALVNNAGMAPRVRADILEATEESFAEILATNLQGPYFLTQAFARSWLAPGAPPSALPEGRAVIFVTSISAETASVGRGEYCVSKAGLSMAAKLWAARLAGEGVRVYELRPGIMDTDMTRGARERYDSLIAQGLVPQRRWGRPEDVGAAALSLLSGDFPFSTGSVFHVDGGFQLSRL